MCTHEYSVALIRAQTIVKFFADFTAARRTGVGFNGPRRGALVVGGAVRRNYYRFLRFPHTNLISLKLRDCFAFGEFN